MSIPASRPTSRPTGTEPTRYPATNQGPAVAMDPFSASAEPGACRRVRVRWCTNERAASAAHHHVGRLDLAGAGRCAPADRARPPARPRVAALGFGVALGHWTGLLALLLALGAGVAYRVHVEETALREAFGPDYDDYRARTRRLIPGLY